MKLSKIKKNKKASVQDLLYVGITLFVFAMVILICFRISTSLNTEFQASDQIDAYGKTAHQQITNLYPGIIDNSFLFVTVILSIGTLILAALVRIHPIFLPIYLLAWMFVIFLCAVFSNAYQEMAANPDLAALAAQMTLMNQVMTTLPFIIGIVGALLAIVMYKAYKGDQYGY
uniref:Uncharacterized protein n=2 Tax=viral metagenome TaxID=1070528 RepID=A0A6H1ZIN2_9ZZZZ